MYIWGYLEPLTSHHHFYDTLLRTLRVYLPDLPSKAFVSPDLGIPPQMFKLGALQLSLSQFPRSLFPEILGFLHQSIHTNLCVLEASINRLDMLGYPVCETLTADARFQRYGEIKTLMSDVMAMYLDEFQRVGEDYVEHDKCVERIQRASEIYQSQLETAIETFKQSTEAGKLYLLGLHAS